MSATTGTTGTTEPAGSSTRRVSLRGRNLWLLGILGGFVLLSLIRVVSGADDMDSSGTLRAALVASIPIAMAGLGGLWSERAGVVNIGLEGMMILGTLGAGYFGYHGGWLAGIVGGIVLGALGGILHAVATVIVGVDHIVSGVAINIMALGISGFLAEAMFTGLPGGGPTQSPELPNPPAVNLGFIADPAKTLEDKGWFLLSDLGALVGALTRNLSLVTIFCLLLFVVTAFVLWRTSFGLRLRSCGESPAAAESLGVNVYRFKFVAVVISGAFAGLGGAFLAMVASPGFQQGQTGGRGYIGLAAMIFGNWRPGGLLMGSGLFGYTNAMQLRSGGTSLHALLLGIAIVLIVVMLVQLRGRNVRAGVASGVVAALAAIWFLSTDRVPREFTTMAPYVVTLLVLAFASQQLRMPAADGLPYRKGSVG